MYDWIVGSWGWGGGTIIHYMIKYVCIMAKQSGYDRPVELDRLVWPGLKITRVLAAH